MWRAASLSVVFLSERAGDGGPRLELARDESEVEGWVGMAAREGSGSSAIGETSFAGSTKGPACGVVVQAGLYGQRSETREMAGLSGVEAMVRFPARRKKHLCVPCVRQQVGNRASASAVNGDSASKQGATESSSRSRAQRRLTPSRLICGFSCIC